MEVSNSPVPVFCKGQIEEYESEADTYIVNIYSSPIGPLQGGVSTSYIYSPGSYGYKTGDVVRVLMYFMHDNVTGEYMDSIPKMPIIIMGKFNEDVMNNADIKNFSVSEDEDNNASFVHDGNKAGMYVEKSGTVNLATTTGTKRRLTAGGAGLNKDADIGHARNFHRQILDFQPNMPAREYFGMYSGEDLMEESTSMAPDDHKIVFRRFVPSDKGLEKWTSLCEGSFDPYVGGNNSTSKVEPSRDTVYSRVSQNGTTRVTTEHGEPGDGFFRMRLDKVIMNEKSPKEITTPAVLGNIFEANVSEDGNFSIKAGGKGVPAAPPHGLKIEYDGKDLDISCDGAISFNHGVGTDAINSFTMDPNSGIDFYAKNGFRVNDKTILNENFLSWFDTYKTSLCQVTQIGGPAPIFPQALAEFQTKSKLPMSGNGFTTKNIGPPAKGVIITPDEFFSI